MLLERLLVVVNVPVAGHSVHDSVLIGIILSLLVIECFILKPVHS